MLGAAVVGGAVGSIAGNALAGDKDATKAKEAEALTAENEAKDLQRKADEAKAKADAARAATK